MSTFFGLLFIVGLPILAIWLVLRLTGSSQGKSKSTAGFNLGGCCSGLATTFRHPIRGFTSMLAGFVGWLRRGLAHVETKLNLSIINNTVAEKRDQAKVLAELLGEVGKLGLKAETVDALQEQIALTSKTADGLESTTAAFGEVLQALVSKESQHAAIKALATQAGRLNMPKAAMDDIDERLRIVGNELEVQRVSFAQQVEHMASRAQRS